MSVSLLESVAGAMRDPMKIYPMMFSNAEILAASRVLTHIANALDSAGANQDNWRPHMAPGDFIRDNR